MSDPRKFTILQTAPIDVGEAYHCDLCFIYVSNDKRQGQASYVIHELRVVCSDCMRRFSDEYDELYPAARLNFSVALVARGYYSEGRAIPPSNGLGGRE